MSRVEQLGYLLIGTPEIAAWKTFATEILGMMLDQSASDEQQLLLRMDEHPARLIVQRHDSNTLLSVGWQFATAEDYQAAIAALRQAKHSVQLGDAAGARQRRVSEYASSVDPDGNPFEIYHGRTDLSDDFRSPLVDAFVTGDMGMGHVVLPTPNMDASQMFYNSVLGFGNSDDLVLPPPSAEAPPMNVRFLHAANPRHHSLGLFNFPNPVGLVHFILEVASVDEVGRCLDRVTQAGYPLMATLGRHCNDNMLSFYVVAPGGFGVEYGCQGRRIDWRNFEPTKSTVADIWGHQYAPLAAEDG